MVVARCARCMREKEGGASEYALLRGPRSRANPLPRSSTGRTNARRGRDGAQADEAGAVAARVEACRAGGARQSVGVGGGLVLADRAGCMHAVKAMGRGSAPQMRAVHRVRAGRLSLGGRTCAGQAVAGQAVRVVAGVADAGRGPRRRLVAASRTRYGREGGGGEREGGGGRGGWGERARCGGRGGRPGASGTRTTRLK